MPREYKLVYFWPRARGEVTRMIFAQAGVDFEDERIEFDKWPEIKAGCPFLKIPYLLIDGHIKLAESLSIVRYLSREFGLAGKDSLHEAKADMITQALNDVLSAIFDMYFEKDEKKKSEMREKFTTETVPARAENMERILKCNNDGKAYLVGDSLTYADLMSYHVFSTILDMKLATLDKTPLMKAHTERIGNLPNIKAWVQKRPKSDF